MRMIWLTAAALMSVAAIGGSAVAQPAAEKTEAHETVQVFAPYVVRREAAGRMKRENLQLISVDRPVSFHDLDLKAPADQTTLVTRVKDAAKDACKELERRYPKRAYIPVPENEDCVKAATDTAMIQVNALIAGASIAF